MSKLTKEIEVLENRVRILEDINLQLVEKAANPVFVYRELELEKVAEKMLDIFLNTPIPPFGSRK